MTLTAQIATHFREVFFGGNWTDVALKETLADVTWQQAITRVYNLNTIAGLVYHSGYYVRAALPVIEGRPLNASDKDSFDHPPITAAADWQALVDGTMADAALLAARVEQMDEATLFSNFGDGKYGNWHRNIHGIIEHTHYHLGQIVLIKKILNQPAAR